MARTRHGGAAPRIPLVAGIAALAWLLYRTGSKPSRLAYPCQQAAFSTASLVFGGAVVAAAVALRRRLRAALFTPAGIGLAALCVLGVIGVRGYLSQAEGFDATAPPTAAAPAPAPAAPAGTDEYRAQVFVASNCPQDLAGDRFPGLDTLVETMGAGGLKFYKSAVTSLTAGPGGIIAPADVVIIKINYQWPQRGGTNTDLLRGLIARIVEHPDAFTGEIVVCENTQFQPPDNYDRTENNAQDHHQSPLDVVTHFQSLGHRISMYDWTAIRTVSVGEYSAGDTRNGYVVGAYDPALLGRVSYPKFQTAYGTMISTKLGVWTAGGGYDRSRYKFINVPVLKSHHSTYGATACVKHYMGVATRELSTNTHTAIAKGILGALIGQIRPADLNILDCIWINANPSTGPATTYTGATRRDQLVASRDPVAADIWAVKNILIPAFVANGYSPPWPTPSADPDDPNSAFRKYLDASMSYIRAAGFDATNDLTKIDLHDLPPPGEPSDPKGPGAPFTISLEPGGFALAWSAPVRGGPVVAYNLYGNDLAGLGAGATPECEAPLGSGTSAFLTALTGNRGFIVVGRNAAGDGSFGADSRARERASPAPGDQCP